MKEIKLTMIQRDALLFKALIRNVFPKPKNEQMYFTTYSTPQTYNDSNIYLSSEYYNILFDAIKEAERDGKFRSSNAEKEWQGLINGFNLAKDVSNVDYSNLKKWDL